MVVHILHIWVWVYRVFTMGNVRPIANWQWNISPNGCLLGRKMMLDWGFHQKESQNQPEILGDTPRNRILNKWDVGYQSLFGIGFGFPGMIIWGFFGLSLGGVKWRSWFLKKPSSRKKIDMVQLCSIYHNFSWNLLFCLFSWLLCGLDFGRSFSATARYHIHQLRGQCGTPHQSVGSIWMRSDVVTIVWGVYRCL